MTKETVRNSTSSDESCQAHPESDALVKPWQRQLNEGQCFIYRSKSLDVLAWGEVLAPSPCANYRLCRVFSTKHPDGQVGDLHVAVVHGLISKETLEKARAMGWPADEDGFRRFAADMLREMRERQLFN